MRLPISGRSATVDRSLVLDGEVGDAASRIEPVRRRECRRRADVEAGAAGAAMIAFGVVGRQIERGEDRAEKQPGAELARHQVGVLALPADAGGRGERLFHHRRGVDEDLDLAAGRVDQPAANRFEPRFDHVVIIVAAGIDRDAAARAVFQDRQRIGIADRN